MSGGRALYALLTAAAPVTALVGTRIYPQAVPLGTPLPALAYSVISVVEQATMCATGPYALVSSRVQIDVFAATYPELRQLMAAVKAACRYARGSIGGVNVQTTDAGIEYADGRDTDRGISVQSVDFTVTYTEPR